MEYICFTQEHMAKLFAELTAKYNKWKARYARTGAVAPPIAPYDPTKSFEACLIDLEYIIQAIHDIRTDLKRLEASICDNGQAHALLEKVATFGITMQSLDEKINEDLT